MSLLLAIHQALVAGQELFVSKDVEWEPLGFWEDAQGRIEKITAANYQYNIVENAATDQVWLLMLAKRRNDLSLRAIMLFKELLDEFHPRVRFGYIDIHHDEALKVAFGEEAVPFTFAIFGGRVYRYQGIERLDYLQDYLRDLEQWKKMPVQFDLPQRPATRLEIVLFDIKKEVKKFLTHFARTYMEAFHELRTGSKEDFEDSTELGFSILGVLVLLLLICVYKFLCTCCCCGKRGDKADKHD